jgi:hypothetical protein
MTTNTTRIAINTAEILLGWLERNKSDRPETSNAHYAQAWRELEAVLPLWLGFLTGTVLGGIAYITVGLSCVLLAILPVGSLALWYAHPRSRDRGSISLPTW